MRISPPQKLRLLQSAKHVYLSYLAFDFFKNKAVSITDQGHTSPVQTSFLDIVKNRLQYSRKSTKQEFSLAEKKYCLCIEPDQNQPMRFIAQLTCTHEPKVRIKLPKDYEADEQICDLLVNKPFIIDIDAKRNVTVSTPLSDEHSIGGSKKHDLYRTHLVTLYNITRKIEQEEDLSSLLIALATGSGKTYVQAVFLEVLVLAKFNGIFAIPNNLMAQFRKDLSRLLPDSITNKVLTLCEKDDANRVADILSHLQDSSSIVVASSKFILDNYYNQIRTASPDQTCMSFDEQHLLMENECLSMRLLMLSDQFLSLFLTATPNEETYKRSGRKPVAIMSSGQKQKAGQGQFPKMEEIHCEFISDKHAKQRAAGHIDFFKWMMERLILSFEDAIQPECSSAIRAAFDQLPFILNRKEGRNLRERLQIPAAFKILCVINDNESLVNGCHALQCNDHNPNAHNIYHNGNFIARGGVAEFFGLPEVDQTVLFHDREEKERIYREQLNEDERPILEPLLNYNLKQRIKWNMFHYLVEYVLSDISGRSLIEHNKLRKQSADNFKDLIVKNYQYRNESYFRTKLLRHIDAEGANIIAPLLANISERLGEYIQNDYYSSYVKEFTDNWFLQNDLLTSHMDYSFQENFDTYAEKYLVMGVMTGMQEAETPIQDSQPFLGLREERYRLYDQSGMQASRAKRRKRTTMELFSDRARESSFFPQYVPGMTEEIADYYFEWGLVGIYMSNKKSEGFSDPNLHTIINIAEKTHDLNNSPTKSIQILGRARGLDDTVFPQYILGLGHKQKASFDLNLLSKADYYPELFRAQKYFEQTYIAVLGEEVGKDIITWYHQHQDADETIDPDALKKKVLRLVAQALRRLNIQNSHQIHLSRAQLPIVIAHAMKKLNQEIAQTQRPYQLSLFVRVFGTFVNFVCECYFTILRFKPWITMFWLSWELAKRPQVRDNLQEQAQIAEEDARVLRQRQADALYLKIIRQAHFKDLVAQGLIAAEFKSWLMRKTNAVKTMVEKSLLQYLKPEIRRQMDVHLDTCLFPLLEKMIVPEKTTLVREKLKEFDGIVHLVKTHEEELNTLQDERNDEEFSDFILSFMHKIPGLESLHARDIINYPARVNESKRWFQQLSLATVNQEPELKEQVAVTITEFLQNEAPVYFGSLLTYPDHIRLMSALRAKPGQIRAFVDQYLNEYSVQTEAQTQERKEQEMTRLFSKFKEFIAPDEDIQLLSQRIENSKNLMKDYQISCIADTLYKELLPCLVNLYPQSQRGNLLAQINIKQVETLLHSEQESLQAIMETENSIAIADFLFMRLCTTVPAQIDINQEKQRAEAFFAQQTNGWGGFTNGMRYFSDHTIGSNFVRGRIEKLLITDEFFDSISLLLPYHHWQGLKNLFKTKPSNVKALALALSKQIETNQPMTPEHLLREINTAFSVQYFSTQNYGKHIGDYLKTLSKGDATHCATPDLQMKMVTLIRQEILPLLAVYLQQDELKQTFLSLPYSDQQLCEFFVANFVNFKQLDQLSPTQQIAWMHAAMDYLCPNLIHDEKSLIDPAKTAKDQGNALQNDLHFRLKTVFCMSEVCKQKLPDFFNSPDGQAVQTSLNVKETAEQLIRSISNTDEQVPIQESFTSIRESVPGLSQVYTLQERLDKFKTARQEFTNLGLRSLDNLKLADLVMKQMWPILQHKQFKTLINLYLGALNQEELALILSARQRNGTAINQEQGPQTMATTLLRFKTLINKNDMQAFKQEFMQSSAGESYEFEHTPLKQVLDNFAILAEEVMQCHCYYEQHDEKGVQNPDTPFPAFFANLSDTAKGIRIPAFDTFMSKRVREIFFFQGVRNGLAKADQVFADSHKETLATLKNIRDNLLRPLWWTVNTYRFVYHVIVGFKTMLFCIQNVLYWFVNAIRHILGLTVTVDPQHSVNEDQQHSAFATAKIINELTPLTPEQVAEPRCPRDVITRVERMIAKLPGHRVRLFAQNNSVQPIDIPNARPILT